MNDVVFFGYPAIHANQGGAPALLSRLTSSYSPWLHSFLIKLSPESSFPSGYRVQHYRRIR